MNLRCRKRESRNPSYWHGILFEEPNQNREPPKRPNWALCMSQRARGKENTQPAERSSRFHGGEANPKQRLGGTSGQTPNADSQRQAYKRPTTHRHDVAEPRETVTASEVRKGEEGGGGEKEGRREGRKRKGGRGVAKEGDGEGGEEMGVCGKQTSLRAETEERKSEERRT